MDDQALLAKLRRNIRFAKAASLLALFVALGGTAWAVKANSIGSKQLKNGAVKSSKLADGAVDSPKVEDGSLTKADFAAGQIPAGEAGPQGIQGPQGAEGEQGPRGPSNAIFDRVPVLPVEVTAAMTTVVEITLPAGSWTVSAGGLLNNNSTLSEPNGACDLRIGGVTVGSQDQIVLGANLAVAERMSVAITGARTVTAPAAAQLRCSASRASANVVEPYISAIQTGALSLP